jgi:hypothetical protein
LNLEVVRNAILNNTTSLKISFHEFEIFFGSDTVITEDEFAMKINQFEEELFANVGID